jgi:hypothetical protein
MSYSFICVIAFSWGVLIGSTKPRGHQGAQCFQRENLVLRKRPWRRFEQVQASDCETGLGAYRLSGEEAKALGSNERRETAKNVVSANVLDYNPLNQGTRGKGNALIARTAGRQISQHRFATLFIIHRKTKRCERDLRQVSCCRNDDVENASGCQSLIGTWPLFVVPMDSSAI